MAVHDTRFLSCRDLGHAWDYRGSVARVEGTSEFQRSVACIRCGTERHDRYSLDGDTVRPKRTRYDYPKGYVVKGGLSRGEARAFLWFPRTTRRAER